MLLTFLFIYLGEPTLQLNYVLYINDYKKNYLFLIYSYVMFYFRSIKYSYLALDCILK